MAYPLQQMLSEVAFIAYHFHWALDDILQLPHRQRAEWVGQISEINKRIIESTN